MKKQLPIDPQSKLSNHIDALFGEGTSELIDFNETNFEFSRNTGRLKHFFVRGQLGGTFRTDGGIALTTHGAEVLIQSRNFMENCVVANQEAVPFVSEGRSLFCRHVEHCGSAVKVGSDVAVLDENDRVIAVGVAMLSANTMQRFSKGVAVRVRQGLRSRISALPEKE